MNRRLQIYVVVFFFAALNLSEAQAQEEPKPDPFKDQREQVEKISVGIDDTKVELLPGPLYTYEEVIHNWHDGTSWVWGSSGRPAVFLNMMTQNRTRYYEFISLTAASPDVSIGYDDAVWKPKPNWKPQLIPNAKKPSSEAKLRLIQMRGLARRFQGTQYYKGKTQELRGLTQPIFRYREANDSTLDGAIFCFLRNGDLETLLVIEASKQDDGSFAWMFDCKPVSISKQEMRLDKKVVWTKKIVSYPDAKRPSAPYHIFLRAAEASERIDSTNE